LRRQRKSNHLHRLLGILPRGFELLLELRDPVADASQFVLRFGIRRPLLFKLAQQFLLASSEILALHLRLCELVVKPRSFAE
jgi:hypothetical protein